MPRISVIIPAYNEEKYISRCLDSLLEQTYEDFEIIAIDDGSKDKTLEILKSYEKKYKKIKVLSQEHKGPGEARNFGAKKAIGEILIFVDADMEFDKDYVKNLTKPILEGKCIGTTHAYEYVANKENIWARCWGTANRSKIDENAVESRFFRAILKEELSNVGFFEPRTGYFDDSNTFKKINKKGLVVRDAICYHYNPSSLAEVFFHSAWIGGSVLIELKNNLRRLKKPKFFLPVVTMSFLLIFGIFFKQKLLEILLISSFLIIMLLTLNRVVKEKYVNYLLFLPIFYIVKFFGLIYGAIRQIPNIITKKIHGLELVYKY